MSFVHDHRRPAAAHSGDIAFAIRATRLLTHFESASEATFPTVSALAAWGAGLAAPVHVGHLGGKSCWLYVIEDKDAPPPEGWSWQETRAALAVLTPSQCHAVSCARELTWWLQRHRFCGCCGTPTIDAVEERARLCPACGAKCYPSAAPAVIVAVTRGDQLLLAHNTNFRPGLFSLLAGFVDPGETLEHAAVREVREESGIEIGDLRYISSQPWPFPNSLMVGFRATFISGEITVDTHEIVEAGWFTRDALPEIPSKGTVARDLIDSWLRETKG